MLLGVRGVGHPRGGGRAGDVGDRRDVVPVDAVADAEQQPGEEDAEVDGGRGDGGGGADEVEHVAGPRGLDGKRSRTTARYRNRLHLRVVAALVYAFAR